MMNDILGHSAFVFMSPFNTRSLISPSYPTSKSESFDDEVKEKKYPTSKSESFDDEVKEKKI